MRAKGVVDGERPVGAAHADVHVQTEHELAPGGARVLGADLRVARAGVERPQAGGERMRSRRRHPQAVADAGHEVGARPGELASGGAHGSVRLGHDLELGGRHLELEACVAAERADHLGRPRREIERAGVEQHQLLLEPHRPVLRSVERGPQVGGGGQ